MFSNRKGFTLVETLIALAIMVTSLMVLSQSISAAFARTKKTQVNFEIASLLERKMIDVQMEYGNKAIESIPEDKEDNFGEKFPDYRWKLKSKKLELPDLSALLTSQDGGADQMTISVSRQLFEAISSAIKEVTVTVIYKPKDAKKPLEASVTKYFVDYDKPVEFGAPQ
jgi:general secretion pathway protein I